jgi:hypothetical protein
MDDWIDRPTYAVGLFQTRVRPVAAPQVTAGGQLRSPRRRQGFIFKFGALFTSPSAHSAEH